MAGSLNKVTIIGNVGREPEIRTTNNGTRIATLRIATSESWRDKSSGERKEKTEWHQVVVWNDGLVGVIEKYVSKGDKLYIEGKLETRKWTDQSGNERYSTEIVLKAFNGVLTMLSDRRNGSGGASSRRSSGGASGVPDDSYGDAYEPASGGGGFGGGGRPSPDDLDDQIPFGSSDLIADPAFRKYRIIA